MLKIGDTAPDFELQDQASHATSLASLLDKGPLIIFFYPIDFSPICTAQACAMRDNFSGLTQVGTQIVGISPQSVSSHRRFAEQFNLPFPLLSDSNKKVIRDFGTDGPLGFGVRRATFLVDTSKVIKSRVSAEFFVGSHVDLIKQTIAAATA